MTPTFSNESNRSRIAVESLLYSRFSSSVAWLVRSFDNIGHWPEVGLGHVVAEINIAVA